MPLKDKSVISVQISEFEFKLTDKKYDTQITYRKRFLMLRCAVLFHIDITMSYEYSIYVGELQ